MCAYQLVVSKRRVEVTGAMSHIERPRPTRYFSFHYCVMRFVGMGWWHHPDEGDTRNFPGWYLYYSIGAMLLWVVGFVSLETVDPFIGEIDMDRIMFSLSFVITHNLTVIKLYLLMSKNKDVQKIVRTIEIELQNYYQNEERNRITIKICKIVSCSFIFFGWMTVFNSYSYGAIQDIQWKTLVKRMNDTSEKPPRSLYQPIYIPWSYESDASYIPTFILEVVGILWNGHILLVIDTFIGSIILHLSSQFGILSEGIETAYDRTMKQLREGIASEVEIPAENNTSLNVEESNERIVIEQYTEIQIEQALKKTLVSCFRQHQVLINCVEKFSSTYSYGFMTQLLSSTAAICAVMVQVSKDATSFKSMKLMTSIVFFSAMIIQLAIQCFGGNELTLQASRVADATMNCKWERMPHRLQLQLVLVMARAQRPIRLTAAGFAYMNNECFVAIMKAAYSYYAVLSQTQDV